MSRLMLCRPYVMGLPYVKLDLCRVDLLSGRPFVRLTFCRVDILSGWPFVGSTFCWVNLLSGQPFVGSTFCRVDAVSGWPFVRSTFCWVDLLLGQPFVGSTFCRVNLLSGRCCVGSKFCLISMEQAWRWVSGFHAAISNSQFLTCSIPDQWWYFSRELHASSLLFTLCLWHLLCRKYELFLLKRLFVPLLLASSLVDFLFCKIRFSKISWFFILNRFFGATTISMTTFSIMIPDPKWCYADCHLCWALR